jgi:hypothetical protein
MNQQPRSHHIQMKYLLIKLMLTEPEETFTLYSSNEGELFLSKLWHHVGMELPVAEQLSNQGAAVHYRPKNYNNEAVVLVFPEPKCHNEARFLGAFRNTDGTIRVFCLEQSFSPNQTEPYTMLAEISLNGRANWGVGSEPSVEAFLESVDDIMSDDSNEPLTFTAMPMF